MGRNVLALIAGDETKHYLFYRDLALAGFAIDPSAMMIAAAKQASNFAMPGSGIPNFTRHAVRIAREGIYGLSQFLKDVLDPVLSSGTWITWRASRPRPSSRASTSMRRSRSSRPRWNEWRSVSTRRRPHSPKRSFAASPRAAARVARLARGHRPRGRWT